MTDVITEAAGFDMPGSSHRGATEFIGDVGRTNVYAENNLARDAMIQNLKDIAAKPYISALNGTGALDTATAVTYGKNYFYVSVRDLLKASPAWPMFQYFAGVRFTTRVHVVVSNTPMVSGVLRLAYNPVVNPPDFNLGSGDQAVFSRQRFTATVMQLPGVDLVLNSDNSAILDVPWLSPLDYMYIQEPVWTGTAKHWPGYLATAGGAVTLNSLTPIRAGDSSVPTYVVYVSFHDIEVFGEAPTLVAQSGMAMAQAGVDDEEAPRGVISRPLHLGAKVLSYARDQFGSYPVLSSALNTASWFTRFASRAASAFGFSKPPVLDAPTRITSITGGGYGHLADAPTYALQLGATLDNRVVCDPRLPTEEIDEMSLDYVLTRPSPLMRITWLASSTQYSTLAAGLVAPNYMLWTGGTRLMPAELNALNTTKACVGTPLAYVSSMFKQWRGSIKLTFCIARTPYHGGKLLIGYTPGHPQTFLGSASGAYVGPPATNLLYKSAIWDVKSATTMEFDIPYVSAIPYNSVDTPTGVWFVRILEPLVAPASVAPTVDILVTARAGSDFELAVPSTSPMWLPLAPALVNSAVLDGSGVVVAQSGKDEKTDIPMQICVGERIASLKSLALMGGVLQTVVSSVETTLVNWSFLVAPTVTFGTWTAAGTNGIQLYGSLPNPLVSIAWMYAYGSGGIEYEVTSDKKYLVYLNDESLTVPQSVDAIQAGGGQMGQVVCPADTPNVTVKQPYYARFRKVPLSLLDNLYLSLEAVTGGSNKPTVRVKPIGAGAHNMVIRGRFTDDACYSTYVGAPLVVMNRPRSGTTSAWKNWLSTFT